MEDELITEAGCCCCGCADVAPAAPVYVEPDPLWEEPVWVEPAPMWEEPVHIEPTYVEPMPVAPAPPVYVEPAPVEPAPAQPAPVYEAPVAPITDASIVGGVAFSDTITPVEAITGGASIVGGNSFSDDITIVDPSGGAAILPGTSIVGGNSFSDDITIVDPSGGAAILPGTSIVGGGVYTGGGGGATSGLMALTEMIAERQEAHRAALDGATWAPGISGDADAVTRGIVTSNQLRLLGISERNLNDVMSPLWHSSDEFNPYSPRYPGRA